MLWAWQLHASATPARTPLLSPLLHGGVRGQLARDLERTSDSIADCIKGAGPRQFLRRFRVAPAFNVRPAFLPLNRGEEG